MGRAFYVPLDSTSKLVLLALADHANDDGSSIHPGLKRLQAKTGSSRATVQRALKHLEGHGLIKSCGYRRGGRGRATAWTVNVVLIRLWADRYEDDPDAWETVSQGHCLERKECHLEWETVSLGAPNSVTAMTPQPSGTIKNQDDYQKEKGPEGGIVAEFRRRIGES
jgi:DNA-binding transcriptional ArsR family regulator